MFSKTQQRVILIATLAILSFNAAAQITLTSGNGYLDQPATVSGMVIKKEGIIAVSGILALQPGEKLIHHQFVDGFGRPIESIAENASPDEKAIVSFSKYDNLGRQSKQYLGYEGSTNTVYTDPATAITDQYSFYNTGTTAKKIAADIAPFSQAEFEASPLQRPLKQGGVGDGFQTNQHYKTIVYRTNTGSSSGQDKVRYWNTAGSNSSYYAAGELTVTELTDEAGNKTFIFKDKLGRLILKRQQADDANYGTYFDTYYGYDEMGNLSFIIPPKADIAITSGSSITTVPNLVYQYVYDEYNRVIEKKTPGTTSTGWEYIIYDPLGRVVLTQNGKLRAADQWLFIKYDNLNRPIIQGIYTDATNTTRSAMQTHVNGQSCYAAGSTTFYEFKSHKSTVGVSGGYSSQCFPVTGRTDHKYINYDNYEFDGLGVDQFTYQAQGLTNETGSTNLLFGMPTVVRRRVIGGNRWLREVTFYDRYYHPIQVQTSNQYDPATITDYTTNVIDFSGKLQTFKTTKNTGSVSIDVLNTYTYDYMDRLKQVDQSNNNATAVTVARYEYNPLGQLVDKKLHSTNGTNFLQSVDYRFNIRGQLTTINNSQRTSDAGVTNDETNDLFGMEILYEKQDAAINNNPSGNAVQYTGLITGTKWSAAPVNNNTGERSYVFTYDKLYRLQTAVYKANTTPGAAFTKDVNGYNETIAYDANGNITDLNRNAIISSGGSYILTAIDDLRYFYTTNSEQLRKIDDAVTSTTLPGFKNLMGSNADYTYDENGSLSADPKKGTTLTYNEYNKITAIIKTSTNSKVEYVYTADGIRITKKVFNNTASSGVPSKVYEYIGGFVFENDNLSYYAMPEGRVRNDGGSSLSLKMEYFITDYQSNTRVSFQDNGSGVAVMRQENSYYAFGMQMPGGYTPGELPNKKLYNAGSEWQDDIENLADYYSTFLRNYDAIIGRFNGVDPMAATVDMLTVYNYANNNPVNFNDPLGGTAMSAFGDEMQARYRAWHDSRYGDNSTMRDWGFNFTELNGRGGSSEMSEFDFYSTYQGLQMRLNDFGSSIKHGFNNWGQFGYWQSEVRGFTGNLAGRHGITLSEIGVAAGRRWVSALPSFATLLSNYPLPYAIRPDRTPVNSKNPLDDATGENFRYFNQCAIRMSICLSKSGVNLKGVKNVSNPGGQTYAGQNVIGALNLATHLKTVFGKPIAFNGTTQDITTLLNGKTGIIFFQNFPEDNGDGTTTTSWANTHIDLWNNGTIMMNEQYVTPTNATRIWFWEVK